MIDMEELGFRENNGNIIYSEETPDGVLSERKEPQDGDDVTLVINHENINVINIKKIGDDEFEGTIQAFMSSGGIEFNGLKLEEKIKFNRKHVIVLKLNA